MQYITGNSLTIRSSHQVDKGTGITVINNTCLILSGRSGKTAVLFLDPMEREELLKVLRNPPVSIQSMVKVGALEIEYDNRGEPYMDGISLSLGDVDVFMQTINIPSLHYQLTKETHETDN